MRIDGQNKHNFEFYIRDKTSSSCKTNRKNSFVESHTIKVIYSQFNLKTFIY